MAANIPCPACSSKKNRKPADGILPLSAKTDAITSCGKCGAIFTRRHIYLGESYAVVYPRMTADKEASDRAIYFDLDTIGSAGEWRRHGWFDPKTRLIVQVG